MTVSGTTGATIPASGGATKPVDGGGIAPAPSPYPQPVYPPTMWDLQGSSISDISKGVLALYDRDGNGSISGKETTRTVTYDYGWGYSYTETLSIDRLVKAADANHDGRLTSNELTRALRRFDTGDQYGNYDPALVGTLPNKGRERTAHDGRLSGSEFSDMMNRVGEYNIAYNDYGTKPIPAPGPGTPGL